MWCRIFRVKGLCVMSNLIVSPSQTASWMDKHRLGGWLGSWPGLYFGSYRNILRVPDQNGVSQAWYKVQILHSGRKPSICCSYELKTGNREWLQDRKSRGYPARRLVLGQCWTGWPGVSLENHMKMTQQVWSATSISVWQHVRFAKSLSIWLEEESQSFFYQAS